MKLAIIGTGIAGMSAAYFLKDSCDITVFEKNDYTGGHTHTHDFEVEDEAVRFDSGFMVFNFVTYPLLTRLFEKLNVPIRPTDMSFSVQNPQYGLEFSGTGLRGLFARYKNVFSGTFYRFLWEINRFNKNAHSVLDQQELYSLSEFKQRFQHTDYFFDNYLIPMTSAVWSSKPERVMEFPAQTLFRFFYNHGLLGVNTQHQWYTVRDGSHTYRDLLIQDFKDKIIHQAQIKCIEIVDEGCQIEFENRAPAKFDRIILACHADQALSLLKNPSPEQRNILSHFQYQKNIATIHTDSRLMPKNLAAWASWNYRYGSHSGITSTTYYMNKLQSLTSKTPFFVTINDEGDIEPAKILKRITYHHPLFNLAAIKAQRHLEDLNRDKRINFTGSYFRYGFHEDALMASVKLCEQILGRSVL